MIHYVKGDLLASDCTVIGHQVNCLNTMGAGIARQIKRLYPHAYLADCATKSGDRSKLGLAIGVPCLDTNLSQVTIWNIYGQYDLGGKVVQTEYKALEKGLKTMADYYKDADPYPRIGFPKIGCGLAGGNWTVVADILNRVFTDRAIYVYELEGA